MNTLTLSHTERRVSQVFLRNMLLPGGVSLQGGKLFNKKAITEGLTRVGRVRKTTFTMTTTAQIQLFPSESQSLDNYNKPSHMSIQPLLFYINPNLSGDRDLERLFLRSPEEEDLERLRFLPLSGEDEERELE